MKLPPRGMWDWESGSIRRDSSRYVGADQEEKQKISKRKHSPKR